MALSLRRTPVTQATRRSCATQAVPPPCVSQEARRSCATQAARHSCATQAARRFCATQAARRSCAARAQAAASPYASQAVHSRTRVMRAQTRLAPPCLAPPPCVSQEARCRPPGSRCPVASLPPTWRLAEVLHPHGGAARRASLTSATQAAARCQEVAVLPAASARDFASAAAHPRAPTVPVEVASDQAFSHTISSSYQLLTSVGHESTVTSIESCHVATTW